MTNKPLDAWKNALKAFRQSVSDIQYIDPDGEVRYEGSKQEKAEVSHAASSLADCTEKLLPLALDHGVDEKSLIALQDQLRLCATIVDLAPRSIENVTADTDAEITCRQIALRAGRARFDPPDALETTRRELAETAFGREALQLLAQLHKTAPETWRRLSAFNGLGGEKWNSSSEAKDRGKGYDRARHMLGKMVDCGLLERAGAGASKRGGFRITADGLRIHASMGSGA